MGVLQQARSRAKHLITILNKEHVDPLPLLLTLGVSVRHDWARVLLIFRRGDSLRCRPVVEIPPP